MATEPLSKDQKNLNKLIKKRYSGFTAFTYYDYQGKIPEAKKIFQLYEEYLEDEGKIFELLRAIDDYLKKCYRLKYESMYSELPDKESPLEIRAYIENKMAEFSNNPDAFNQLHPLYKISLFIVKKLFGINDTLAKKLLHTDYLNNEKAYKKNIEEWLQYDLFVRRIIKYINQNHPEWEKATKKQKRNLITAYDLLKSEYFSDEDAHLLRFFPEFIEAGYGLHQQKTASAKKLLSYNFPRMTLDIAKKITDQSTKNKKI